jgi:hypothetical protein
MLGFLYGKFIRSWHECFVCKITEIYQSDRGGGLTFIQLVMKLAWQERLYVLNRHILMNQ